MKRPTRLCLLVALLVVASVSPVAAGAVPLCKGKKATIVGTDGSEDILGTLGADVIVALEGHDTVDALAGDDLVCAGPGRDEVNGGDGSDQLFGGSATDTVRGEAGNDHLRGDYVLGGPGDDYLRNGYRDPALHGGDGDDVLEGYVVSFSDAAGGVVVDIARGTAVGQGSDRLVNVYDAVGSEFDDELRGDYGRNDFYALGGNDLIVGGGGQDFLDAGLGHDRVFAGRGFDYIEGEGHLMEPLVAPGNDYYKGGPDRDEFSLNGTQSGHVDLGQERVYSEGVDVIREIENVWGTWQTSNRIIGDDGDNILTGGDDGDHVDGAGGNDILRDFEGYVTDDKYFGGTGNDKFRLDTECSVEHVFWDGGAGNDILDLSTGFCERGMKVDLASGSVEVYGDKGEVVRVENVVGTGGDDLLVGDDRANRLFGGPGGDEIYGRGSDDVLTGGKGRDLGRGGDGSDACIKIENRRSCERLRY